jgi:hypothetical protein
MSLAKGEYGSRPPRARHTDGMKSAGDLRASLSVAILLVDTHDSR